MYIHGLYECCVFVCGGIRVSYLYQYFMIFTFIQDVCVWLYDIYIHTGCMCVVV